MKRISCRITALYEALFKDFALWGLGNPGDAERDLSRIVTLIETRGVRSVFLEFPAYAKLFDFAISRGRLMPGLFPLLGKEKEGLPAFMHSYFERVFDSNGVLLTDANVGAIASIRQILRAFQKVEIPCGEAFVKETVNAFFITDRTLRPVSDSWYSGDFTTPTSLMDALTDPGQGQLNLGQQWDLSRELVKTYTLVCDMLVGAFPLLDPYSIMGNHGPGSVADSKGGDDKYRFPIWNDRLERVFPRDWHGSANLHVRTYECEAVSEIRNEVPAKLIPVPKNQEKPRLIASEPTANQFIQGGMRKYLLDCIKFTPLRNSVNIKRQEMSQRRAIEVSNDPLLATVDLKDASDRLSCWTVERVLRKRPELLAALAACRSAALRDPKYTGDTILLRKYAPQGNATVFPLQSIIYAAMAIAATVWSSPKIDFGVIRSRRDQLWTQLVVASHRVTVYGDDIILPTRALPALSSLLELCQLKVNGAKSHYSGNFAESCGMDAFRGSDVTPAYVHHIEDTESPENVSSTVEVSNNFHRRGLFHASRIVESWVPEHYVQNIPVSHDPEAYSIALRTYSSGTAARRCRYNKNLHRNEILVLALHSVSKRTRRDDWQSLLQYFTECPSPDVKWESGVQQKVRQRLRRKWVSHT